MMELSWAMGLSPETADVKAGRNQRAAAGDRHPQKEPVGQQKKPGNSQECDACSQPDEETAQPQSGDDIAAHGDSGEKGAALSSTGVLKMEDCPAWRIVQ